MSKQIVVVAPPGLSLDLDLQSRAIRAVPTNSGLDEYLVIQPKPGTDAKAGAAGADPGGAAQDRWPIPPIIMSFRTQAPPGAAGHSADPTRLRGQISLDDIAAHLGRMDEGTTHHFVVEPEDGG